MMQAPVDDRLDAGGLAARLRLNGVAPLHSQIEAGLQQLILSGQLPPGTILPGELDLATVFRLSRHTIRHALSALAAQGLLRRERGRGTRVVTPASHALTERNLGGFYAFAWEATARGLEHRSQVLEYATILAPKDLADRLELGGDAQVTRIVRVRTAGGEPLVMETAFIPAKFSEGLDVQELERGSIYDWLERRHGLHVIRAEERIRPIVLSRSLAVLLETRRGSPAFEVERTTWSDRGPVEWQQSVIRGDRFLYSVELPRRDIPLAREGE